MKIQYINTFKEHERANYIRQDHFNGGAVFIYFKTIPIAWDFVVAIWKIKWKKHD